MNRSRVAGFTLLEALVTLVIVSMLVAALMQALSHALSMRTALIRYQRENREGALQEMWFRESVGAAVADTPEAYGPMRGTSTGFELLTLAPLSGDGMARVSWRFERGEGGQVLRYADPRQGGAIVVLDGPLSEGEFAYLDGEGTWRRDWDPEPDADAIPRAVRLRARSATRDLEWTVALAARPRPPVSLRLLEEEARAF